MSSPLDLSLEEVRSLLHAAADTAADYYRQLPTLPVMPDVSAATVRDRFNAALPVLPATPGELLEEFRSAVAPMCRHNGHARFFGYVASPGTPVAAVGEMLASVLNANVTS